MLSEALARGYVEQVPVMKPHPYAPRRTWYRDKETGQIYSLDPPDERGGLELAEKKTRRILFGRFAGVTCLRHGLGRPETFEFLGFKHVCAVDRAGRFALIRIPS